jgi:hypothetical protein
MKISENVGCFLGGCLVPLFEVGRFIARGILWIVSLGIARLIIEPNNFGTGLLFLVVWAILGLIIDNGFALLVLAIGGFLASRRWRDPAKTLIYSQPNWPEELQRILAVEVTEIKGALPIRQHKEMLRGRYRALAEKSLSLGFHPEVMIRDFLQILPAYLPTDDPQEIADSLVSSPEFDSLLGRRDDPWEYIWPTDQQTLRRLYDETNLEDIVRYLNEQY